VVAAREHCDDMALDASVFFAGLMTIVQVEARLDLRKGGDTFKV
jgi:hypothetical protein